MRKVGILLLLTLFMSTSHAAIVQNQQYILQDHPDSALTATHGPYGLRLDALFPVGKGPTFSTQEDGAQSILEWTGNMATIIGTVRNNVTNALWSVSQTFSGVVASAGGFTAAASVLELTDPNNIKYIFNGKQSGGSAFTADDSGYRCAGHADCGPLGARGWQMPDITATLLANLNLTQLRTSTPIGFESSGSNDWLVQLTPVPVPAALPLLASGLLGFSFISRKRKTS